LVFKASLKPAIGLHMSVFVSIYVAMYYSRIVPNSCIPTEVFLHLMTQHVYIVDVGKRRNWECI